MKHTLSIYCLALLSLALASCTTTTNQGGNLNPTGTPAGIEGQWVDNNGIVSAFHGGVFETRAADTREKLSEGNYIMRNPQLAEIEIRSIVRGTVSHVNCALYNNSMQLLCTSGNGAQFSLARKV